MDDFYATVRLRDRKLLKIVQDGFKGEVASSAELELDIDAKSIMQLSVAKNLKAYVQKAASAKLAMDALRQACQGTEKHHKQRMEKMEQTYSMGNKRLKAYAEDYLALYMEMEGLGIQPSEEKAMDRLLNGLTAENENFKRQMQSYRDLRSKDDPFTLQDLVSKMIDESYDEYPAIDSGNGKIIGMQSVTRDSGKPIGACMRCGDTGHWAKRCPVRDALCGNCGMMGHLAKACRGTSTAGAVSSEGPKAMAAATSTAASSFTKKGDGGAKLTKEVITDIVNETLERWQFGNNFFSG